MASIAVLVATYKRNELLEDLLDSLDSAKTHVSFDVIVVDNDPAARARPVAEARLDPPLYLHEPRPGIAAARNRGLDAAADDYEFIAFVDDDERVDVTWMASLLATQERHNADVVSGPVRPVLPPDTPRWLRSAGFYNRPRAETGSRTRWPATNNCLLRTSVLGASAPHRFSEEFSATGGSDTEFFWRLEQGGAAFVWCDEAQVEETVPASRTTARWLWRRGRRLGNVSARMLTLKKRTTRSIATVAIARILATPILLVRDIVAGAPWGASMMNIPKGIGMLDAIRGNLVLEYKRTTDERL